MYVYMHYFYLISSCSVLYSHIHKEFTLVPYTHASEESVYFSRYSHRHTHTHTYHWSMVDFVSELTSSRLNVPRQAYISCNFISVYVVRPLAHLSALHSFMRIDCLSSLLFDATTCHLIAVHLKSSSRKFYTIFRFHRHFEVNNFEILFDARK